MTETKQRIALAEWMGWKWFQKGNPEHDVYWLSPDGKYDNLPDTNSLDVLHEIEMKLGPSAQYVSELVKLCCRVYPSEPLTDYHYWFAVVTANATQRLEALLRTLGLWKD